jgi:outer membrane receptor for Fe3+-dicitrate
MIKTDSELMAEYGITGKMKKMYSYKQHNYEHLKDALSCAKIDDSHRQKDRICEEVKKLRVCHAQEFDKADRLAFNYYGCQVNGYERRLNDIENDRLDSSWIKRGRDLITGRRAKQDIERSEIQVELSKLYHERDACMDAFKLLQVEQMSLLLDQISVTIVS